MKHRQKPKRDNKLEFMAATDLEVWNKDSEPTFCTVMNEVIDFTLCSRNVVREVVDLRILKEPSLSDTDHRLITFKLTYVRRSEDGKESEKEQLRLLSSGPRG